MPYVSFSHAKAHLARLLTEVEQLGEEVVITHSGRPAGVLLSIEHYEGLVETLEILADRELAKSIEAGLADAAEGNLLDDDPT